MIERLLYWLQGQFPVRCARCGRWLRRKDANVVTTTWHTAAYLCDDCHEAVYNPWGGVP